VDKRTGKRRGKSGRKKKIFQEIYTVQKKEKKKTTEEKTKEIFLKTWK